MGKVGFLFPGQGAQFVGMGRDLYEAYPSAKKIFDIADTVKEGTSGLCFEGPAERLNDTIHTQPCLFTVSMAVVSVLEEFGIRADGVAGFSLGEIPALTYAGVFDIKKGLELVHYRAKAVKQCCDTFPGTMFAVLKLSEEKVEELCGGIPNAWPVNYNCGGQTVVACATDSAETVQKVFTENKARVMPLSVSGAFHSPFMENASVALKEYLQEAKESEEIRESRIPIYSNVHAKEYGDVAELLSAQVKSPVLWERTVRHMIEAGYDTFIEVGAGKTLAGLVKKIAPEAKVYSVCGRESIESLLCDPVLLQRRAETEKAEA